MEGFRGTVNRVELIGRLGADPEARQVGTGQVVRLRLATYAPQRAEGDQPNYSTEWFNVEAWDRLGEQCVEFLQRGSRVRVVGRLSNQTWDDATTGEHRQRTVIRASDVLFLDPPSEERGDEEASAP